MRNAGLAPPQLPAKRDLISPAWQHWTNTGTGSLQTSRWPLKSHSKGCPEILLGHPFRPLFLRPGTHLTLISTSTEIYSLSLF